MFITLKTVYLFVFKKNLLLPTLFFFKSRLSECFSSKIEIIISKTQCVCTARFPVFPRCKALT